MTASKALRVGFAGTPRFALPVLEALCAESQCQTIAVYTQPDRPAGRGRQLNQSPVKQLALSKDIPIFQPQHFNDPAAIKTFENLRLDVFVVAAYGLILPSTILNAVKYPINIHASLLPRWRGAAPIQRAIMSGDTTTGITIIRIIEKLDAGPMWHALRCDVEPQDTAGTLHDKLALLGSQATKQALEMIIEDRVVEHQQDESLVCYAEKISSQERTLNWQLDAEHLARHVRGLNPTPMARAVIAEQQCKILAAEPEAGCANANPGSIAYASADGIGIYAGTGVLRITKLQPAGKKPLSAGDFVNGYGDRLGVAN